MSEKSQNALKHQYPPKFPGRSVNQPNSFTPTRADLISSTPRSRDTPQPPSSQYSSTYFPLSNHVNSRYQNISQPPSSGVISPNPIPPATGSSSYVPDSPTSSDYPPASTDHIQRQLSPTPSGGSGPPEYTYSSNMDSHIPPAIMNKSTRRDQYTSFQLPAASGSAQIAPLSISRDSTLPFRQLPNIPNSSHPSSSPKRKSNERHRDSSLSGYSGLPISSTSTSTPNETWRPPAPPSPNVFSGSRLSRIPPPTTIVQSTSQTNHRNHEVVLGLTEDYKRKPTVTKTPPENFVFPPGRSAAHPEKSSKPKSPKSSIHSSKSNEDSSGRLRIIRDFFKKNKGKNMPHERQISEELSYDFIERTRDLKSTYPLDPYNSVLLEKLS